VDESQRVAAANSRARKLDLDADLTLEQWQRILSSWSYSCAYCGSHYQEIDHVIPLSEGGTTTAANVVPSCTGCNRRKGSSTDYSIPAKQLKLWD
jgi:5-methylcytosine-specific restriction endonuclease McrA